MPLSPVPTPTPSTAYSVFHPLHHWSSNHLHLPTSLTPLCATAGRIVKPILAGFYRVRRWLFRNKAAAQATPDQPNPLTLWNFVGRTKPLCTAFYEAPHRQVHWALEILAVDPAHQAKGVGRDLVAWGMARAKCDPAGDLPVVVTAADGKEGFYQKVGFKDLVGYVSKTVDEHGNDNALRAHGVGGGAVLWTK